MSIEIANTILVAVVGKSVIHILMNADLIVSNFTINKIDQTLRNWSSGASKRLKKKGSGHTANCTILSLILASYSVRSFFKKELPDLHE